MVDRGWVSSFWLRVRTLLPPRPVLSQLSAGQWPVRQREGVPVESGKAPSKRPWHQSFESQSSSWQASFSAVLGVFKSLLTHSGFQGDRAVVWCVPGYLIINVCDWTYGVAWSKLGRQQRHLYHWGHWACIVVVEDNTKLLHVQVLWILQSAVFK